MIADTDTVLLALRCLFSEHPHTQDLGPERLARLLWIHGWVRWPPTVETVLEALEPLSIERGLS